MTIPFITPDWPAPANIHAAMTTRVGGVSLSPYVSLNLGDHVGDASQAVAQNRAIVAQQLKLPSQAIWLNQSHSTTAIKAATTSTRACEGDASYSQERGVVCAVMTADCLPLLICNLDGTEVAAIHAGWRGLFGGVIEATVTKLETKPGQLMVWLGAAIGPDQFEVGAEVRQQFIAEDSRSENAFRPSSREEHWFADIYRLARIRLKRLGINTIYGGGLCTYSDSETFFSYRRDGVTGRMASLIWME